MMGSKTKSKEEEFSMDFGFELKSEDKTYTLFTWTREEAEIWVRIINVIVTMNRRGISIDRVNPFDYE